MLRLVLPKGSLERATLELFEAADLPVQRNSSVDYKANIDDPRIIEVGSFDPRRSRCTWRRACSTSGSRAGTGSRTASDIVSLGELEVLQGDEQPDQGRRRRGRDHPAQRIEDLGDGVRVSTEYPELTRRFFEVPRVSRPTSGSPTAPPRPRSPRSPTPWSRSPRPDGPCRGPADPGHDHDELHRGRRQPGRL
ncbi:MAG: hypothetical protein R2705_03405 [Ilumatobacteraceae bacterium]